MKWVVVVKKASFLPSFVLTEVLPQNLLLAGGSGVVQVDSLPKDPNVESLELLRRVAVALVVLSAHPATKAKPQRF